LRVVARRNIDRDYRPRARQHQTQGLHYNRLRKIARRKATQINHMQIQRTGKNPIRWVESAKFG